MSDPSMQAFGTGKVRRDPAAFTLEIESGQLWLYTMDAAGQPIALALGDPDKALDIMADKMAELDFGN